MFELESGSLLHVWTGFVQSVTWLNLVEAYLDHPPVTPAGKKESKENSIVYFYA